MKFGSCRRLDFLTIKSKMFSFVCGTEPVNLALTRHLCKAHCYCWPGKSYSPYLKTCEVDSPVLGRCFLKKFKATCMRKLQ